MYLVYLRNLLRCQSDLLQILQACLPAKATKYMPLFQPHGIIIRCCWSKKGRADLLFFLVIDVLRLVGCYCNGPFYRNMF